MDGRPDAAALGSGRSRSGRKLLELPQPREIVDRHLDADLELLSRSRVHDGDRPRPPLLAAGLAAPEQARHLVERTLGRREPDPLELATRLQLQPLQREEEVRAALGCNERVDLVDDDGLYRAQDLARLRGEQQVERFGRGDEDVRRCARHLRPLARRGVARPDADLGNVQGAALRRDSGQRRTEVALHVHRQGSEGRNVNHPTALFFCWSGGEHQTVDRRQKGSEGLARPGGSEQKGGFPCKNRGPAEGLRARRGWKRRLEPPLDGVVEGG